MPRQKIKETPPAPIHPADPGLPTWITAHLVEETRTVWQPFYSFALTDQDAIEILLSVGRLADTLGNGDG